VIICFAIAALLRYLNGKEAARKSAVSVNVVAAPKMEEDITVERAQLHESLMTDG
jgi:hypothetical protein